MQVQFSNFMPILNVKNTQHNNTQKTNSFMKGNLQSDVFVKNNVSFKALEPSKSTRKQDILDGLTMIGFVGAPFLVSVAAATYMAKNQNPEDIFLPDGSFLCNVRDLSIDSDKVIADADDGIFKVAGTKIDIDATKYDIVDVEKGIYRNVDGSVDIDLLHNKYIDEANGIFIDPARKIAETIDRNGNILDLVIPNSPAFGSGQPSWNPGGGIGESGYPPHRDYSWDAQTRSEFIKAHDGKTPEEYYGELDEINIHHYHDLIKPDDNRNALQKIRDFFCEYGNTPDTGYDKSKLYDIYGREIFTTHDINGHTHLIALDENLKTIVDKYNLNDDSIKDLSQIFNKINLKDYLEIEHPDYSDLVLPNITSMNDFIDSLHHSTNTEALAELITDNNPIGDVLSSEDIPVEETHSVLQDLIDALKDALDG